MAKKESENPPQPLTVEQAAQYLQVDPKTVYRLINAKEIKAFAVGRVYRIMPADLDEFIRQSQLKVARSPRKTY